MPETSYRDAFDRATAGIDSEGGYIIPGGLDMAREILTPREPGNPVEVIGFEPPPGLAAEALREQVECLKRENERLKAEAEDAQAYIRDLAAESTGRLEEIDRLKCLLDEPSPRRHPIEPTSNAHAVARAAAVLIKHLSD